MKLRPKLGQQVCVEFLDIYLVPVTFVGWCINVQGGTFTLTDGYSRRQFFLFSPMVLLITPFQFSKDINISKPRDMKKFYEQRTHSAKLLAILDTFNNSIN